MIKFFKFCLPIEIFLPDRACGTANTALSTLGKILILFYFSCLHFPKSNSFLDSH